MRTRAMAVEDAAGEKRRKVGDGELRFPTSMPTEEEAVTRGGSCVTAGSPSSDHVLVSCCSSYRSTEEHQFKNLKEIIESKTPSKYRSDTRARKRRTEMKISTVTLEKLQPATELEEFFASAEKELHKRFKDKYNYDIVTDAPMEGRFQWVELKP